MTSVIGEAIIHPIGKWGYTVYNSEKVLMTSEFKFDTQNSAEQELVLLLAEFKKMVDKK